MLGMDVPAQRCAVAYARRGMTALVGTAAALAFLPMGAALGEVGNLVCAVSLLMSFAVAALWLCYSCVCFFFWLLGGHFARYFGTAARSLIPLYAAVMVVVGWGTIPALGLAERVWIRNSAFGAPTEETFGFTTIETRLTQRLKAELIEAGRE